MIPRRRLLGLAMLGGAAAGGAPLAADATPEPQLTEQSLSSVVRAIQQVGSSIESPRSFTELVAVRSPMRDFLVVNGKWPDYLDVGLTIWMNVHDWHIRWQQPLSMGRDATGRYTLVLMQTVLVLRPDQLATYVGLPYDKSPQ